MDTLISRTDLPFLLQARLEIDDVALLGLILLLGLCFSLKGVLWDKPDPYHHLWFEKPQSDVATSQNQQTRDIGLKLEQSGKSGVIFWGSQSGTAEELAGRLTRDIRSRFGLNILLADLADYDPETLQNIPESKLAIFILSTYGEGDPSDNAIQLLSWLQTKSNASFSINLSNLRYAALGLGNSNYKFYNRVVDVFTEAVDRFQAKPLLATGKADDFKGATEEDFIEWKQKLFLTFQDKLGLQERPLHNEPSLKVVEDASVDLIDIHAGEPVKAHVALKSTSRSSEIRPLPVKIARHMLINDERNCLHIEVDTANYPELKYKTGDHLAVWPSNPRSEVTRLINVLGLQDRRDMGLLVSSLDQSIKVRVPSPTTLGILFTHYLEICAPVPREVVLSLVEFAPSPSAKAFLSQLGSNKDTYHGYCVGAKVTLGRLLEAAISPTESWSQLPLSFVVEMLSPLQARRYSISSSAIVSPNTVALTVSTNTSAAASNPGHAAESLGLTTGYLTALAKSIQSDQTSDYKLIGPKGLLAGNKIFASIITSKFRLPVLSQHPLILIASGSGIAPFRGFLQERARLVKLGREVGPMILFYGCRTQSDFLYSDELATLQTKFAGKLDIHVGYSRDGNRKTYVQDRVKEHLNQLLRRLRYDNAHLYICGCTAMAKEVERVISDGVKSETGWREKELVEWSEGMKKSRRWQEDVWG
ncbi:putative NADPH-cytochrome P450 reductase [Bisporella sp. PMI_857]|nr:putative NADPH-cytochrome P450 reductase [Bisporella sp. PMI_857]